MIKMIAFYRKYFALGSSTKTKSAQAARRLAKDGSSPSGKLKNI
jgi:hypothetical protein